VERAADRNTWRREQIDAAIVAIGDFEGECMREARKYRRRGQLWSTLDVVLGVPSAVLAGLAGASALTDLFGSRATGVIALLAAGLSAALAVLKGREHATEAWTKYEGMTRLVEQADNYVRVEALVPEGKELAPALYRDFTERRTALRQRIPLPEMWSKGRPMGPGMSDEDMKWLME
jgi:hypothetical protein